MTCEICKNVGGSLYWHGRSIGQVHQKCLTKISPFESEVTFKIHTLLQREYWEIGHEVAIRAVQKKCGECSISKYLKEEGSDALTNLFNTVGVEAVDRYVAQKG